MATDKTIRDKAMRELSPVELEVVSGGYQYPVGWPDGAFGSSR
jgi:hypothetical protein